MAGSLLVYGSSADTAFHAAPVWWRALDPASMPGETVNVNFLGVVRGSLDPGAGFRLQLVVGDNPLDALGTEILEHEVTEIGVFSAPVARIQVASMLPALSLLKLNVYDIGSPSSATFRCMSIMFSKPDDPLPPRSRARRREEIEAELYGVDIAVLNDIPKNFALVGGRLNVCYALVRRFSTRRGSLFYDLDYGLDLREYLSAGVTDEELSNLPEMIRLEAEKDPRVQSAEVGVRFERATQRLTITIRAQSATGPFSLVLAVSAVTVELLDAAA